MKDSCIIKSFPNGINLILKADVTFELLLEEIGEKVYAFARREQLDGHARSAVVRFRRDFWEKL